MYFGKQRFPPGQPHSKYKANSARTSHIAVWERDPQSLGVTGDELHDGAERGPVDRDGARSTKPKHNSRPKSEPRQVCWAVEAFPFA